MKRIIVFVFGLLAALPVWGVVAVTAVEDLRVNGQVEPSCVEGTPVFSWRVTSNVLNTCQASWEITLTENGKKVFSCRDTGEDPFGIVLPYTFVPGARYGWTLKVTDNHRRTSKPVSSTFVMGPVRAATGPGQQPCPEYKCSFSCSDARINRMYAEMYCHWSADAVLAPWRQYRASRNLRQLEAGYPSMKDRADAYLARAERYLLPPQGQPYADDALTSRAMMDQCFFAHTLDIVAQAAALLGKTHESRYYADAARLARDAFINEYVTPNGLVSSDTQTAYALALHFDMLPENLREQAVRRLMSHIDRAEGRVVAGRSVTPYLFEELSRYGQGDLAFRLLQDGGAGDWLHRWIGGLRETEPGYHTFVVDPHPGGGLRWAETTCQSPYGPITVKWTAAADRLQSIFVEVPVGTIAVITCPDGSFRRVGSGTYSF